MIRLIGLLLLLAAVPGWGQSFRPEKGQFMLKFKDEVTPYRTTGAYLMPGDTVRLEVVLGPRAGNYTARAVEGNLLKVGPERWQWVAPTEAGIYPVRVISLTHLDTLTLHCFVMVPRTEKRGTTLQQYKIGNYPNSPKEVYRKPEGFVRVTQENQDTYVSPHFQLKDFLCKQASGYPKFVVLRERLILKLEMLLEAVNDAGYTCDKFVIMSGYRTPFYNKAIGNVQYSRHQWGDAADIFIDQNGDYMMDDLNGDGRSNVKDARLLYRIVDDMKDEAWYQPFLGGMGLYAEKPGVRGPFVHVDTRGYPARWGH